MINFGWFKDQLHRLGAAFGAHDRRIEAAAQTYHNAIEPVCSESQFLRAVEHALKSCEKMPTIKTLLEIARMFPDAKTPSRKNTCRHCSGTGIVAAVKNKYRHLFACPACGLCPYAYPAWNAGLISKGWQLEPQAAGWNEYDAAQLKGLALMGKDSKAWKLAPQKCRDAAENVYGVPRVTGDKKAETILTIVEGACVNTREV